MSRSAVIFLTLERGKSWYFSPITGTLVTLVTVWATGGWVLTLATSAARTLPPGPDPETPWRLTPFSLAMALAKGLATTPPENF